MTCAEVPGTGQQNLLYPVPDTCQQELDSRQKVITIYYHLTLLPAGERVQVATILHLLSE